MQYAAGYQYRTEKLTLSPSAALLSGDIAGLGGATKGWEADRNVNAVFGELNIPVIQNLDLNLAARYDDYSDVGSTTNWKANVRWQPTQQLLLRGSYGTGFRAPTLDNVNSPLVLQTSATIQDPDPATQFSGQVNELTGGNPNLEPETSTQYSLGLVFQPLPTLAVGLDWFSIQVNKAISQPATQWVIDQAWAGVEPYKSRVKRDPATGLITEVFNPLGNNGTIETQGFDVDMRYRENLGPGVLAMTLNGTYYTKFNQSVSWHGDVPEGGDDDRSHRDHVQSSVQPTGLDGLGVVLRYKQYLSQQPGFRATGPRPLGNQFTSAYYAGADWAVRLETPMHQSNRCACRRKRFGICRWPGPASRIWC